MSNSLTACYEINRYIIKIHHILKVSVYNNPLTIVINAVSAFRKGKLCLKFTGAFD